MREVTERIPEVIKNADLESGLTKAVIAERLDITARHLQRIEKGENKPSLDLLGRIVRVLSIPPESIFYDQVKVGQKSPEDRELDQIFDLVKQCDKKDLKRLHAIIDAFVYNAPEQ